MALFTFLIEPLRDYGRIPHLRRTSFSAFLHEIVLFTALNAFLESSFFRRADPVWLFLRVRSARLEAGRPLPHPLAPRGIAHHFHRPPNRLCRALLEDRHVRNGFLAGLRQYGLRMLSVWLKSGKLAPAEVFVVEPNAELRERAAKLGAETQPVRPTCRPISRRCW